MNLEHRYWLAGVIDGEGSIIIKEKGLNKRKYVSIVIANDSKEYLDFAKKLCDYGGIYKSKNSYQLKIERKEVVMKILEEIKDYLIIKKRKAILALEVIKNHREYFPYRVNGKFSKI